MSSMLEAAPDGRASVARLQEAMRQLVQQLRHLVTSHPLTARAGEALERAVARAYARLLPVLAELSRNSLLAGGLGLAVGLAIGRMLGRGGAASVLKPLQMRGILIERLESLL